MKTRTLTIIITILLLTTCKNAGKNQTETSIDSLNTNSVPEKEIIQPLPPLEPGDYNITDKAFGETIDLIGEPVNVPEKIKPEQLFVKNNYLITQNQRKDSLFMIFR